MPLQTELASSERRIRLSRSSPLRIASFQPGRDAFRIVIMAELADIIPNEIFLYQRSLIDPVTSKTADEFMAVCSPFDLNYYPANAPNPIQSPGFFRKNIIDGIVPGQLEADQLWASVQTEVNNLIVALNKLDQLQFVAQAWCPAPPNREESSRDSDQIIYM